VSTFILIPGAGGVAWYWHRVVPLLRNAKHNAIAVDLPGDDERASLSTYADRVIDAIGTASDVVLVAQSLGGFTAPLVCERARIRQLVFVNAMIPLPNETAGDWWQHTQSETARLAAAERHGYNAAFDLMTYFLHDVPADILAEGEAQQRKQAGRIFAEPCQFDQWPDIPIQAIAGRDDRFFPVDFQRRVVAERLNRPLDVLPGGHLIALSNPAGLARRLLSYLELAHR
jgi:pimeloyl-ACP methyl ester carboxylesterase